MAEGLGQAGMLLKTGIQMGVELREQFIARSESIAIHNNYKAKINDHANAASQL